MRVPVSLVAASALVLTGFGVAAAGRSLTDGPTTFQAASSSSDDAPGDISGPCDEVEHAGDPRCAGITTAPSASGAPTVSDAGDLRSLDAAGAGTVAYRVDGATLTLLAAAPNDGWRAEVEQSSGRELEVDFRSGTVRVQVNVEFEDGGVRERVRTRDDSTDVRTETETTSATSAATAPTTVDDNGGDVDRDDRVEVGDDRSVNGSDDGSDDRSGSNRGDDHSGSGHDGSDDDSSGHGGHGGDD